MSTCEATVDLSLHYPTPRHRATPGWDWSRAVSALSLVLLALGVYGGWAWIVGPVLVDFIGLWPTRAVGVALIALTLWRRS